MPFTAAAAALSLESDWKPLRQNVMEVEEVRTIHWRSKSSSTLTSARVAFCARRNCETADVLEAVCRMMPG
jgi:hypothetical protein